MADNQGVGINERIKELIDAKGFSPNSFAIEVGIKPQVLYNIIAGRKSKPSFDVLEKILTSNDDVNSDWLILGEGEMLKGAEPIKDGLSEIKKAIEGDGVAIPLYNAMASAGGGELALSSEFIIDQIQVPFGKKQDVALTIFGDSMTPYLHSGDLAIVREMHSWREYVEYGKVFVVVTMEEVFCKVIKRRTEKDDFVLHSINQEYRDFEVPMTHVSKIYKVMGVVSQRSN